MPDEAFVIGGVRVPHRVVLAPMAGITGSGFRRYMKRHGAGLVFTEMVSAYGVVYGNQRTWDYLAFSEEERPIGVQLFGDRPDVLSRAAQVVLERRPAPELLDINMGCPARKVMKTGAGAALLRDPDRAVEVAEAVIDAARPHGVPVTVKARSGVTAGEDTITDLAPRLEAAGVAAITVHPRTADMMYKGCADHDVTARVAGRLGIPVIASGDVNGHEDARRLLTDAGAAAVMVGRAAQGDPWVVRRILAGGAGEADAGGTEPVPTPAAAAGELRRLFACARDDMGDERAVRWIRKFTTWYLRPAGIRPAEIEELRRTDSAAVLDTRLGAVQQGM